LWQGVYHRPGIGTVPDYDHLDGKVFNYRAFQRGRLEIIPMHRELKKGLESALLKRLEEEGGPT